MTARCEPPPELRDRNGWHQLANFQNETQCVYWNSDRKGWYQPRTGQHNSEILMAGWGWSYLAPVLPPAEVQALRDENARLRAALKVAATAELIGPDGIIDADVLEIVQHEARVALTGSAKP
jgi:hypothetical protein